MNYGTPDSESEISSILCGGCGALLHCKHVVLPGYLPSELFFNKSNDDLKSLTCQMSFHENYKTCLDVRTLVVFYGNIQVQVSVVKYNLYQRSQEVDWWKDFLIWNENIKNIIVLKKGKPNQYYYGRAGKYYLRHSIF